MRICKGYPTDMHTTRLISPCTILCEQINIYARFCTFLSDWEALWDTSKRLNVCCCNSETLVPKMDQVQLRHRYRPSGHELAHRKYSWILGSHSQLSMRRRILLGNAVRDLKYTYAESKSVELTQLQFLFNKLLRIWL